MNSYTFTGLDVEEGEVNSRRVTFIKRAIAFIKSRRQANRLTRNRITRDRSGAHERLVAAFFSEDPMYDATRFRKTFRMARPLFNQIVNERTSRTALDHFFQAVMEIYGPEYLRKPTVTDIEKLYRHHEEKHGFSGMLRSLDCIDWEWFGCPYDVKGQYVRRDHGPNPFILLKAVASQDLWIWHAFFGVAGSNNDMNLKQESKRKDVERAFGVLKKKWAILANLTRALKKERIINMMYTNSKKLPDGPIMADVSNVPELVDKKGDRNPITYNVLRMVLFQPKTAEGANKPEAQWSSDERRVVNQDQRLKSIIISCLPGDIIEYVIRCEIAKDT
ncbi:ALP1-like protein [Tanacetum coccineum]